MMFPSATLIFSSINKHNILPRLAGRLGEVFSDQVPGQDQPGASCQQRWSSSLCLGQESGRASCQAGWCFGRLNAVHRSLSSASCTSTLQWVKIPLHQGKVKIPLHQVKEQGRNSSAQGPLTSSHVPGCEWLLNFKINSLFHILSFLNFYDLKYWSVCPITSTSLLICQLRNMLANWMQMFLLLSLPCPNHPVIPFWTHINSQLCLFQSCKADLTV